VDVFFNLFCTTFNCGWGKKRGRIEREGGRKKEKKGGSDGKWGKVLLPSDLRELDAPAGNSSEIYHYR